MAFSIRIAIIDSDGNLEMEYLKRRGKIVNDWNVDKLRRFAEQALAKRGFTGLSCWACKEPGRRYEWTAERWPPAISTLLHRIPGARKRAGSYVCAEIVL